MFPAVELAVNSEKVLKHNFLVAAIEEAVAESALEEWPQLLADALLQVAGFHASDPEAVMMDLIARLGDGIPAAVARSRELEGGRDRAELILARLSAEDRAALERVMLWM